MNWKFNEDYDDYAQVEQFYPKYDKIYQKLKSEDKFPYNSLFEGKLGIDDKKEEKTAIYLLQSSRSEKSKQQKIKNYLKEGYQKITKGEGRKKFKKVVQIGTDYSRDSVREFEKAKIIFKDGYIRAILPKRARTRGYFVYPDRVILAK